MTLVYIELLVVVGLERFMDAEKLTLEKCKSELCNFVWGGEFSISKRHLSNLIL